VGAAYEYELSTTVKTPNKVFLDNFAIYFALISASVKASCLALLKEPDLSYF
jgi:hypothetical protein